MLKLTVQMLRRRVGAVTATLVALTVGVVLFMSMGTLVESGLRYQPGPQRYVPSMGWVAVIGGTTLPALLTTVLPVGRLLRTPPVQNIGLRE